MPVSTPAATPAAKLDWKYLGEPDEERAEYRGYVIRAVRDDHPSNPFKDWDCNWPIIVRASDGFTEYCEQENVANPLPYFNDAQLVHDQRAIAKVFGFDAIDAAMEAYVTDEPVKRCTDAAVLRDLFDQMFEDVSDSDKLDKTAELFTLAGIKAISVQRNGYCQGDWAEVLVVAPPDTCLRFGCVSEITDATLEATADLYAAWAYGDCYGYVICRPRTPEPDPDADPDDEDNAAEIELEELDSCWGYYGADHEESGLAEAAIEAVDGFFRQAQLSVAA